MMTDEPENPVVVDTRFQSHRKFFIRDLLNADLSDFEKFSPPVAKINGHYVSRISISGMVVDVKEMEKGYRLRIDDSTGVIQVTVWKSMVFQDEYLDSFDYVSSGQSNTFKAENQKLFQVLDAIKSCIKDKSRNNWVVYEPTPGDLVMIKATIGMYQNQLNLRTSKCTRIQNINDELINMVLPSTLDKVYAIPPPTNEDFERMKSTNEQKLNRVNRFNDQSPRSTKQARFGGSGVHNRQHLLDCVLRSLKGLTKESGSRPSLTKDIKTYLGNTIDKQYKSLSFNEVHEALKELESQGLIYSCSDEHQFLPMDSTDY